MIKSLKGRLSLLFAAILLVPLFSFILVFNARVDGLFDEYANQLQQRHIQQVAAQVNDLFQTDEEPISLAGLEVIGNAALQNGIILHVQALNQEIDWDIATHRSDECKLMLQHREQNMHSRYPSFDGGYTQQTIDIIRNGFVIGQMTLGYYGPFAYNDMELDLVTALNRLLVTLCLVFIIIASALGVVMAVQLTKPISSASSITQKIAYGDYGVQIEGKYSVDEIKTLVDSINAMSVTLQEKEQQKRRLTADVAHELRTPLTNLQGHIEAIIDGIWEPTTELMESCHEEINRLTNIVNQLLELDKYEDGRIALQYSNFQVQDLFADVLNSFMLSAQKKEISIESHVLSSPDFCYADEARLKQCMVNLISNALRYTPPGGKITLSFTSDERYYCFQVCDTGTGISKVDLSQIFERFYRADKSRVQHTGGVGIGLTITKAIVEIHRGTISVDSEIGKGTSFTILLPREKADN